jgi:ABC-type glycerol-3-phosphate transport system substrate-binding protein
MRGISSWAGSAVLVAALWAGPVAAQSPDQAKAEWDRVVAAAEKEGTVVINSQPNPVWRDFILREFAKAYPKIELNFSMIPSEQFVARVRVERQTGKYLWDLGAAGAAAGFTLYKDGAIDPLLPELILPEVNKPEIWGGWDEAFVDTPRKYVFSMSAFVLSPYYNAAHVPADKVAQLGLRVMLDPAYAGKTVWQDPAVPGSGQSYATLMRTLGDEDLRKLLVDQKATLFAQQAQIIEAMARATAWFGIGPSVGSLIAPYVQAGAIKQADIQAFGNKPEVSIISIGGNCLYVLNQRPHPNATRVFVNWMLQKDVQMNLAKAIEQDSRRQDIPPVSAPEAAPIKGAKYSVPQREEAFSQLVADAKFVDGLRKAAK